MFRNAKKLAPNAYLIVGVCADEEATPYKRQPVMNTTERTMTALGCRAVDEVIEASPLYLTDAFLDEHRIDLVVHGDDFSEEKAAIYYGAAMRRGMFRFIPYTPSVSTSDILHRIGERGYLDEFYRKKDSRNSGHLSPRKKTPLRSHLAD